MIAFWLVAGVLAAVAAGLILHRAAAASRAALVDPTMSLYRRQLTELDDLADRGLLAEPERKAAHAEAARRLLGAAEQPAAVWTADASSRRIVLIAAVVAATLAAGLYLALGAPGQPDQPFARRLASWRAADPATLGAPQMAAVLAAVTAERPRDPEAWRYRAMAQAASGDLAGATRSLREAVQLAPQRAELWEMLGEIMVDQAAGAPSPGADTAFRQALKRDPKSANARFYLARGLLLAGDRTGAVAGWRALLADMPADDESREAVERAIAEAGQPSGGGEQMQAIRGMVAGLAAKLQDQPDDPAGWVRLVRSYAVLGDAASRDAALKTARVRFARRPDVMADLDAAAKAEPMR
jgi:cytochrome c-type biogenesis protein CcmH